MTSKTNTAAATAPAAAPGNGTHAARSAAVKITAAVLMRDMPRPDVADHVQPGWKDIGRIAAQDVLASVVNYQVAVVETSREGLPQLARGSRDGRTYWNPAGNMLKGFARSALMSAFFEAEGAARAWNRYAEAQAKANAEHGEDAQGIDGQASALDVAAGRAMEAIGSAAVTTAFACELARICRDQGDGEEVETSYTPRAAGDKPVAPRAAATLRAFLNK